MIKAITCGTFDYHIHKGHIQFLTLCSQLCDHLIVALTADQTIRATKHRDPYFDQRTRAANLLDTNLVGSIISLKYNDTPLRLLDFNPDLYILGKDQNANPWSAYATTLMYANGVPAVSSFEERIESTTSLLNQIGWLT